MNSKSNSRRNFIIGGVTLGASSTGLMVANPASAAITSNPYFIRVGIGGEFTSLHEAVAAAKALNPTSSNWVVIYMMPGSYDLASETNELALPDFTELAGASREGCIVLGNGNKNIRVNSHNRISNCSIKYTGTGNRSGAIRPQDSVNPATKGFLRIDDVDIEVYSTQRCAVWVQYLDRCYIHNCLIQTSGIGVETVSGHIFISNTHCRLVSNSLGNSTPHYGIKQTQGTWSRIWIDGGTWATGYGTSEINGEPDSDIVMFYAGGNSSARVELNNVWCIVRNNSGASAGKKIACVEVSTPTAWVRVRGGYYQAEDPNFHSFDLMNSANGRLEIQGCRYKSLLGNSYSANGAGVRMITDAIYTPQFNDDGIKVIDASKNSGGMVVKLSASGTSQVMGSEQVLIRIDNSGNTVTIDGNGQLINGSLTRKLGSEQYSKMILRYVGPSVGWLVLNE